MAENGALGWPVFGIRTQHLGLAALGSHVMVLSSMRRLFPDFLPPPFPFILSQGDLFWLLNL
jgi:hypothetical protein